MHRATALLVLLFGCSAHATAAPIMFEPSDLMRFVAGNRTAITEVDDKLSPSGRAIEAVAPFRLEGGSLQRLLTPGWYRLVLRVRSDAPIRDSDTLTFSFASSLKGRIPDTFRYETTFSPGEFAASGNYGELSRTFFVGPGAGSYYLSLYGFKGLRIASLSLEALSRTLGLEQVRTNKILYGLKETGTVAVHVLNGATRPQAARLTVRVESGLDDGSLLLDRVVSIPGAVPGRADVIEVPLPAQPEYGHCVVATLRQADTELGTAKCYFYSTDRPASIGHLGYMGIDAAYGPGNAAKFVERMRHHSFPMYEIIFWAPDDVLELIPPAGKDRWWSGQTLARMSTESLKERIRLGHDQGMKVLAYTNLRYDFGYRIKDIFRRHPEFCEWDANNNDQAYSVNALRRQAREDDVERFERTTPNKPKFNAQGVWRLASGNPAVVDAHIDQLVRSTKVFDWDGFRYDDRCNYDEPAVDLLGRRLPEGDWRNPGILARIRDALEKAKPGMIYGHNLEWAQDEPAKADVPMPLDTPPHPNDYYTEFLRDGGLHLQERWLAQMNSRHVPWEQARDYLLALGHNAYRRGGYAYGLSYINNARPVDGRHLIALHCAGLTHVAGDVRDGDVGSVRLACRYADLLYGDHLVPLPGGEKVLHVDVGGKPLWWQRYVRYRQVAPGRRVYLVHLINPPRDSHLGSGEPVLPEPITNVALDWKLPSGWKATRAYQLTADGEKCFDTLISEDARSFTRRELASLSVTRRELPIREEQGSTRMTVPKLDVWSVVAVDCEGPPNDAAPDVIFKLPPVSPEAPRGKWEEVHSDSANRVKLIYDISDIKEWTRPDPAAANKRIALESVHDATATTGRAARCVKGWELNANRPGDCIEGGLYRFSFHLKSTETPPAGAHLSFSAWSPAKHKAPWRINESIALDGLTPDKGWQTFRREFELGYAWDNFSFFVNDGFDELLIDQVTVEEIRCLPDSERLKARGLAGWPAGLQLTPHSGYRVWIGEGLYSEYFHLDAALGVLAGVTVDHAPHWTYRNQRGFDGAGWTKAEDLARYDLIVLANIDLRSLPLERRDWLRGYVEAGGSLLLTGGPYGLGRGGWHESDLIERLLPAKLHAYDLRPAGVASPILLRPAERGFYSEAWNDFPTALWLHEVEPKPGATVHLTAGDRPALITGTAGKGRVALLALTPLGEAPNGVLTWWQWPGWDKTMAKALGWLLKQG
jgi:uncharacterized membrane protein